MSKLVALAISSAVSMAANLLLQAITKKNPKTDENIVDPSVRGTLCNYSLGLNRVTPVVGYVGNTKVHKSHSMTGSVKSVHYYQSGLHFLTIGPGANLRNIFNNGKSGAWGAIDSISKPSGSHEYHGRGRGYYIYWGEDGQPVSSRLTDLTGISSAFPFIMYVLWDRISLGGQKIWPQVEYEIFVPTLQTTLFGKNPIIEYAINEISVSSTVKINTQQHWSLMSGSYYLDSGRSFTTTDAAAADIKVGMYLISTSGSMTFESKVTSVAATSISGTPTWIIYTQDYVPTAWDGLTVTLKCSYGLAKGINPAAIIYQLLFESYPHGLGLDTADYDLTDLEDIFDFFNTPGTLYPASLHLSGGKTIKDGLAMIMQDCGIFLAWDTETSKYRFIRADPGDTTTLIKDSDISFTDAMMTRTAYSVNEPDIRVYSFKDCERSYKESTITVSNDGKVKYTDMPNVKRVPMETVRDITTASWVAAYRDRENYSRTTFSVNISKELIGIQIGGLFEFDSIDGHFRLINKQIIPNSASFKASFIEDIYSEDTKYTIKKPTGLFPVDSMTAFPDMLVVIFEVSRYLDPDVPGIYILRVRQNNQIEGAYPYIGDTTDTYVDDGFIEDHSVGGVLTQDIAEDGPVLDYSNYTFNLYGPDADKIIDLTTAEDRWRSGEQMCKIGSEIFFVEGITPTATSGEFQFEGLIRARIGTAMEAHSIGDTFVIFPKDFLKAFNQPFMIPEATVKVKTVPYTEDSTVDISEVTAETLTYGGGGAKPLPVKNLSTTDKTSSVVGTNDTLLEWDYFNLSAGQGCGLGYSDEGYARPEPEGYFRIEFLTTSDVLKREETTSVNTFTYTYLDRNTDFGTSNFKIRVYNILNGIISEYTEETIEVI